MSPDDRRSGQPEPSGAEGVRDQGVLDEGLQEERTSLAWERTAIATMVVGVLLARFAALQENWFAVGLGLIQTVCGATMLVWASMHYEDVHRSLRAGEPPVRPTATRVMGLFTIGVSATALVLAAFAVI